MHDSILLHNFILQKYSINGNMRNILYTALFLAIVIKAKHFIYLFSNIMHPEMINNRTIRKGKHGF